MANSKHRLIERLFGQQQAAIASFIARRVRRKSDAVDLTQEVYLRLLRLGNAGVIENPEGYLFAVAANLVKEHAALEVLSGVSVEVSEAQFHEALTQHPIFESAVDLDARAVRLREVIGQLAPKCRAVVVLKYQQELSYGEIAVRLGISTNMVKKYLAQALVHCRRRMSRLA